MPYKHYDLPSYPVQSDLWDRLAAETRPIVVYGMGNGADKLFERLARYGLTVSEVFASDGFVRGHSFRGYKVKTLSEVEAVLGDDFIILVSFASGRSEVIDLVRNINGRHELYIPDMPVAGEEYFDKEFYNSNYGAILAAYSALSDEDSINTFASVINYKLTGNMDTLFASVCDTDDIYALLPDNVETAIDAGAYNGDTCRELMRYRNGVKKIYAVEPDVRNYKKLIKFIGNDGLENYITAINAAAWSRNSAGVFSGSGNRNSSVDSTVSYETRKEEVQLIALDSVTDEKTDYIKYDVEGAEAQALIGTARLIKAYSPALLISAYHRSADIFALTNYIKNEYPQYSLYIRRTPCFPAWEIALIAVLEK
jgi:FkbM family methyltransferase